MNFSFVSRMVMLFSAMREMFGRKSSELSFFSGSYIGVSNSGYAMASTNGSRISARMRGGRTIEPITRLGMVTFGSMPASTLAATASSSSRFFGGTRPASALAPMRTARSLSAALKRPPSKLSVAPGVGTNPEPGSVMRKSGSGGMSSMVDGGGAGSPMASEAWTALAYWERRRKSAHAAAASATATTTATATGTMKN